MSLVRIGAAAGSLAVTAVVLLLSAAHTGRCDDADGEPGAAAQPARLIVAGCAVVLVTVVDRVFNQVTGRAMPIWPAATTRDEAHDDRPDR